MSSAGSQGEPARASSDQGRPSTRAPCVPAPALLVARARLHASTPARQAGRAGADGSRPARRTYLRLPARELIVIGERVHVWERVARGRCARARRRVSAGARASLCRAAPRRSARDRRGTDGPGRIDRARPPHTARYESTWPLAPRAYYASTNFWHNLTYFLFSPFFGKLDKTDAYVLPNIIIDKLRLVLTEYKNLLIQISRQSPRHTAAARPEAQQIVVVGGKF